MLDRRLPEKLRPALQRPLGRLLKGDKKTTRRPFADLMARWKPTVLIAVGDSCSKLVASTRQPAASVPIFILDGREKRRPLRAKLRLPFRDMRQWRVKNPPGMLSGEAVRAVRRAVGSNRPAAVRVEGEEDLLALPAILYAPAGAVVVYGQPGEGVVAVKVNKGKRRFAKNIIARMEALRNGRGARRRKKTRVRRVEALRV